MSPVQKGLARDYSTDPRVIKAVLLNSARPLANWTNNATRVGDTWTTTQPLDYKQGAGQIALDRAYVQYDAPSQSGVVEETGWDLNTVAEGSPLDYPIYVRLEENTPFVATLVWFMDRDVLGYDPAAADPFAGSTLVDNSFANLDLELWSTDAQNDPLDLVAESISSVDSVEHVRFDIPRTDHYLLRVKWTSEVFDNVGDVNETQFGIAWSGVECFLASRPTTTIVRNRYLTINSGNLGRSSGIRVILTNLPSPYDEWNGVEMWLQEPKSYCENAGVDEAPSPDNPPDYGCPGVGGTLPNLSFLAGTLGTQPFYLDWAAVGTVHVHHEAIIPGGIYKVQVIDETCPLDAPNNYSEVLPIATAKWSDACGPGPDGACSGASDGVVDVQNDVLGILNKFSNTFPMENASGDLAPREVDFKVDVALDVLFALEAFQGLPYPFSPSGPPPNSPGDVALGSD